MKKTILFVVLIVAMLLAACAPAAPQSPAAAEKPTVVKHVEVIWYVRSNVTEQKWQAETVIPDFEKNNPGIKINLVVVPWANFDTKMQSLLNAGTPADIWSHWGPSGFQDYVKRGLVADLTPFIEKDKFDLSDFQEEVLNIYKVEGKIMGLPMLTTGSFIFYNKDQFDKAGVSYPPTNWDDKSWTYDAFLEKCKALTNVTGDPKTDIFGCNMAFWPNDQYVWMFGKDLYPDSAYQTGFADNAFLDSPEAIKAFQARQDMVWKDHFMPDPTQLAALGGEHIFQNGKVAMHLTGGWGWWNFADIKDFNWGVAALPWGGQNRKAIVYTDPWMLSSQSNHPQEAWTFLKYLTSAEQQKTWMNLAGVPPARKSLAEDWYKQFPGMKPEEVKEVHLGALKYGRESPNHLLVKFDILNQVVGAATDPITNNEKKAAETLPEANQKLIEALKQIQKENK